MCGSKAIEMSLTASDNTAMIQGPNIRGDLGHDRWWVDASWDESLVNSPKIHPGGLDWGDFDRVAESPVVVNWASQTPANAKCSWHWLLDSSIGWP